MPNTNVVYLTKRLRLQRFVLGLTDHDFSHCLYGFVLIDDFMQRKQRLAKSDFDAFWQEIGPLGQEDFHKKWAMLNAALATQG